MEIGTNPSYEAKLVKTEKGEAILELHLPKETLEINVSADDQSSLNDVFAKLISEVIANPYQFRFAPSNEADFTALNEVCQKYIEILNNDLNSVWKDYCENKIVVESN